MHRIQIQLTEGQERSLKRLARTRGVSISYLVRESVSQFIASPQKDWDRIRLQALAVVGRYQTDDRSLSTDHDEAFSDASGI
ncbi:MAG: CopG family transcriptional regulator [Candidatus Aquilonibacter sp.]